ncbi:MAG: DUF179 domain-containing protein [Candidatus Marinimicrobia bacterium]|nr:DUF179 domain-containing protein [Candidatus Neomarinimicrobiota bacterium]|tara:strand:+ start:158 stop:703 length:546 start_codon:yes stop_codon:yes gene_type:complete
MNFKNHFLISMPHLVDSYFTKSIIYLCEHEAHGAMGIIINKNISNEKSQIILTQTGLNIIKPKPSIYFGGPVQMNRGLILHSCDYTNNDSKVISSHISITSNEQILNDLAVGKGPNKFRFTFGFTGWSENQLEREFENGDWLLLPASNNFIFDTPDNDKWTKATNSFGIDILDITGNTGIS